MGVLSFNLNLNLLFFYTAILYLHIFFFNPEPKSVHLLSFHVPCSIVLRPGSFDSKYLVLMIDDDTPTIELGWFSIFGVTGAKGGSGI